MSANQNLSTTVDPQARIGHVHLMVADLQRTLDFYCGVLGNWSSSLRWVPIMRIRMIFNRGSQQKPSPLKWMGAETGHSEIQY